MRMEHRVKREGQRFRAIMNREFILEGEMIAELRQGKTLLFRGIRAYLTEGGS